LVAVVAIVACAKTAVLKEQEPVLVSARAPEPPPPPPPPAPPVVEVKKEKIQVNEKIQFDYNKAIIRPDSFGLLGQIARVINDHPDIRRIRIEGHTDNIGSAKFNLDLSRRRAQAVLDYLVSQGKVDSARLEREGYGFDRPIGANDTEEGRALNRRVEFMILERDDGETAAPASRPAATGTQAPATPGATPTEGAAR
jgi:outer membrane protein OmpA-like peptidoglycan-associated protein